MEKVHEASTFLLDALSNEANKLKSNVTYQYDRAKELGGEVRDVLGGEKGLAETKAIAENVSQLAGKLKNKVIGDPIGQIKQLSPCKLVDYAKQCRLFKKENLYNKDPNVVRMELKYLVGQRDMSLEDLTSSAASGFGTVPGGFITGYFSRTVNISAIVGILIENRSNYPLVYKTSQSLEGYFFTDDFLDESFRGPHHSIESGFTTGLVHTKGDLTPQSSAGYLSFSIQVDGDGDGDGKKTSYRIVVGWDIYRVGKNRAALEIREEDENGNMIGQPIEFKKIATHAHGSSKGGDHTEICKACQPYFKLRYRFSNEKVTADGFHLIVENFE